MHCKHVDDAVKAYVDPFKPDELKKVIHNPKVLKCCDVSSLAETVKQALMKEVRGFPTKPPLDVARVTLISDTLAKQRVHVGSISACVGILLDGDSDRTKGVRATYCKSTAATLKSQKPPITLPAALNKLFYQYVPKEK